MRPHWTLGSAAFSSMLGRATLPPAANLAIVAGDFRLRPLHAEEREEITVRVMKHIDSLGPDENVTEGAHMDKDPTFPPNITDRLGRLLDQTSKYRQATWERCYGDVEDLRDLTPPFLRPDPGTPVRLQGRYEVPLSPRFEADFLSVVRAFLFDTYLSHCGALYEFGCGTGHNLLAYAKQCPGKWVTGLDWSEKALDLWQRAAARYGIGTHTHKFDFFHPDRELVFLKGSTNGSGVLTVGALEQVGNKWSPFLGFLLSRRPEVCVHLEPIAEFYNEGSVFDYNALRYHHKRGYLSGFLPALRKLEKEGDIEILAAHRIPFGSRYHEAYSYIVWRPR